MRIPRLGGRPATWPIVVVGALALAGCAGGPAGPQATSLPAAASAGPVASEAVAPSAPGGPSSSAQMVCSPEIKGKIAQILGLSGPPEADAVWASGLYICTYRLPAGTLVLSVQESRDPAAARAYFTAKQRSLGPTTPIAGMANLGLEAYRTDTGTVVFLKDSFTLVADATRLPEAVGPHGVTRSAAAYQIATDVLACWSDG